MNAPQRADTLAASSPLDASIDAAVDTAVDVPMTPSLARIALAALAPAGATQAAEARWLASAGAAAGHAATAAQHWLQAPPADEPVLHALAQALPLQPPELIAVALGCAVEVDPMAARAVAWLQAPAGASRPTVGLVLKAAQALGWPAPLSALLDGAALDTGLLQLDTDTARPLPERRLQVPLPLVLALRDGDARWPGIDTRPPPVDTRVPSLQAAAQAQARALGPQGALVVRSGHPRLARDAARAVAQALQRAPAFIDGDVPPGAGLWLTLCGRVPVLCSELAPGEARALPRLSGYHGPVLVAAGPEGSYARDGDSVASWRVPLPDANERSALWRAALSRPAVASPLVEPLSEQLGRHYRYDAARIHQLAHAAEAEARLAGATAVARAHVDAAARSGIAADLGTLAELLREPIADDVLVVPPALRDALVALRQRCAWRESLADALGPAMRARYRPGVRALFVGASGTGKTLAAGWLATQLGLPLYRVDTATITSKYIGETEKNLAQLFARAEHAEAVLLFDEADALFSKRTEVKESNDRFANAQTNYLLQRIETFEGIALLTSNSRSRFDSAFTRRLDAILDFPQPTPVERRALWEGHLGSAHTLSDGELNRLAGACDFSGGHIRNVVLAAAARARHEARAIGYDDAVHGVIAECRKLGRQPPAGLADLTGRG